ncbi:hypothetical protein DSO57_1019312 [Entomophthora muscae]|uniref:Uncharacterized protein n=1 Tax=Entomophthora muscae TaxID=34485 RepID=A0ACC2RV84_9FUNG|nr:hypothetical protein DSO57_1019312 [Entomophthora muscae]
MASLEQKLDSLPNQTQCNESGRQSQDSYRKSSGQEKYHSLDSNKETNRRLPRSIRVLEVMTENGGPATVTIEDTVKDIKAQQEEECKAASKACFAASKANCNRPASPIWQAVPATTVTHNTLPFFTPANLPRFDRKSNISMFLWLTRTQFIGHMRL